MTITVFYQKLSETRRVDDAFFQAKYSAYDADTGTLTEREGDPEPRIADAIGRLAVFGKCYLPVAVLNTCDLDEAWKATQNIDAPWSEGWVVKEFLFDDSKHLHAAEGRRSAMVGDIYVVNGEEGYVVARTGFVKISGIAARRMMRFMEEAA